MNPKTKTLLVLLTSFLLGSIVGASFLSSTWRSITGKSRGRMDYRTYLHEKLDLDSTQIIRVDSLLDVYKGTMDLHRERVQESRDSLRMEIRGLLSESQSGVYQKMLDDMNKRSYRRKRDSLQMKE